MMDSAETTRIGVRTTSVDSTASSEFLAGISLSDISSEGAISTDAGEPPYLFLDSNTASETETDISPQSRRRPRRSRFRWTSAAQSRNLRGSRGKGSYRYTDKTPPNPSSGPGLTLRSDWPFHAYGSPPYVQLPYGYYGPGFNPPFSTYGYPYQVPYYSMARPYVSHPSQTHLESGNLDDDDKKHSFFQFLLNLRRAEEQQKEPTPGEMPQAATTTQTKMITFTQHNKKLLSKEIKIVQTRVVSGSEDDDHDIAIITEGDSLDEKHNKPLYETRWMYGPMLCPYTCILWRKEAKYLVNQVISKVKAWT